MGHRLFVALATSICAAVAAASTGFESPPVHPLELTPSGDFLLAAHTGEHRVVVFDLRMGTPLRVASIPCGLEPVSVRARTETEIWVVNHLSDSISIVDLTSRHVVRTIPVGDEPTDVVFAGTPERAFVVLSQEDAVLVLDPAAPTASGVRIELLASDPRQAVVSNDGESIYISVFESGNRTTAIPYQTVYANGGPPPPDPPMRAALPTPPRTALIVQQIGGVWLDETGGSWDAVVPYDVLDHDVVAIDVSSQSVAQYFGDIGTSILNLAVHPTDGSLLVSHQIAFNLERFEPNVRGRFAQNHITRLTPATGAHLSKHLNPHIDYANGAGSSVERAQSLALPLDLTFDATGSKAYVAAFSSAKLGVLDATGNVLDRWPVGNGPSGVAVGHARNRVYVLNSIDATVSVLRESDGLSECVLSLGLDTTPPQLRDGRRLFYDAANSSAHGDLSCNSCHLFGGMDGIAWDLGNPLGTMMPVPPGQPAILPPFHPMKGPMITQALKGIQGTEPLHWRGDKAGLADFNGAFVSLMGRSTALSALELDNFISFVFSLRYPPNPYRQLDGSMPATLNGADPGHGEFLFNSGNLLGTLQCAHCHALPTGEIGAIIVGSALLQDEAKVTPQLRNMYEKTRFDNTAAETLRGFGYTHDGVSDDLFSFLQFPNFTFANDDDRRDVASFLLAFDTGTHAGVGAQWTMDGSNASEGASRLSILESLAQGQLLGLIAKSVDGQQREQGWVYSGNGLWTPDRAGAAAIGTAPLVGSASGGHEITFTAVPEGHEWRLGIDRDEDGFLDGDELDAGSDPGNPAWTPQQTPTAADPKAWLAGGEARLWIAGPNPVQSQARLGLRLPRSGSAQLSVFDARGRRVRTLLASESASRGEQVLDWDLRDDSGRRVTSGVYFARLVIADKVLTQRFSVVR